MPIVRANLKLNTADLRRATSNLAQVSERSASYIANKACNWIANRAVKDMPFSTVAEIDAELSQTAESIEKNTGVTFAPGKRRNRSLNLAQRIVLARMHPNSNYNRLTGGVWRLNRPPGSGGSPTRHPRYKLGGQSRTRFWQWVDDHAERMWKARRSSIKFYQLGANVVRLIFSRNRAPVRQVPGSPAGSGEATTRPGDGAVGKAIGRVAGGTLATGTGPLARAEFWVSTTEPDSKGSQRGIHRVLQPVWQRAVNEEADSIAQHAEKLFAKAIEEQGFTVK